MSKYFFLFNPLAGKGKAEKFSLDLKNNQGVEVVHYDITKIDDYSAFLSNIGNDDKLVICGGDGTLNRFVNATENTDFKGEILYLPAGSGNDFMHDLNRAEGDGPFVVNEYINNLPTVTINSKKYRFINGVGFGVDGYVCAEGNRLRAKGKKVDYTAIALKGLLFAFKRVNATVTVDGKEHFYRNVWMTTTMKGRFFGGGMMLTPDQDRKSEDGKFSVLIAHSLGSLKIATLFPSIFKGKHIKYTKYIDIHRCESMTVKYDRPCDLQIDGESISGVTEYSATVGNGLCAVPSMRNS